MKKQLSTLQQLIAVMDPELYRHFGMFGYQYSFKPILNRDHRESRRAKLVLLLQMGPDRIQTRVPIRRCAETLGGPLDRLLLEPVPIVRCVRGSRIAQGHDTPIFD